MIKKTKIARCAGIHRMKVKNGQRDFFRLGDFSDSDVQQIAAAMTVNRIGVVRAVRT